MTRIRTVTVPAGDDLIVGCHSANRPDRGLVVVGVASEMRRPLPFVQDLLAALGCKDDVAGAGRHVERDLEHCTAWLHALDVKDLVLVDAQWLHPTLLATAIEIATSANVDLWLVCQQPVEPSWDTTIAAWPHHAAQQSDLTAKFPTETDTFDGDGRLFPRVVDAPWVTFRSTCRDLLPEDDFRTVDRRFVEALDAGLNAFDDNELDEQTVLQHLYARCQGSGTFDEMLVEARASQVAAWRRGWLVQIDINQFTAVARTLPTRTQLDRPDWWQRLRIYPEPWRGTVCALAAVGLGCTTMTTITVGHIDLAGHVTNPTTGDDALVPAAALSYVRAQRTLRLLQGATTDDPLFATDDGRPVGDRRLAQALLDAQVECGLNMTGGRVARGDLTAASWASRLGISVQPLKNVTKQ